jgi:AcrR family transcriptional regulator
MAKESSRNKLIDATIEAIYLNGLHSVTTSKIAKTAHLSEAMIYRHFGNKDEMILESFLSIKADLNRFVESGISDENNFDRTSHEIWTGHVNYFLNNPPKLSVLNQVEHSNYMTDEIRQNCLSLSEFVIRYFSRGIEQNLFKPMHIEIAIALYFSPLLNIAESIIEKRMENSEENLSLLYTSTMAAFKNKTD